jgi:Icc-related predicted phosphoesterase
MKIVCISDTHNCNEQVPVPDGDVLIHSGDATVSGTATEIEAFANWFRELPHRHKIFVAGNHDWLFETRDSLARELLGAGITYLRDAAVEIRGLRFYGSPWQPRFFDWAFNLDRGADLAAKWALIPDFVDVLITHGPPNGVLDAVPRGSGYSHEGCEDLAERVSRIAAKGRLKAHVFGHIHSGHGTASEHGVTFVNCSICDEQYAPTNDAIVVDL